MVAQGVSLDEVDSTAKPAVPLTKAEQAVKLIAEANMEAHAGRYEQALAIFQRAYEIEPLARTLLSVCLMQSYNVARCQEARATCQQVRTMSPRDPVAEQARVLLDRLPCP
jgi:tetratricopeptide (TPR) repeat protein